MRVSQSRPTAVFVMFFNGKRETLNVFVISEDFLMLEELQQRVNAIEEKLVQIRGYL